MKNIKDHQIFNNAEELFEDAESAAQAAPTHLQQVIKLYFIARYLTVSFEAQIGRLPIQVWNEYRNTLDHFFRHIQQSGPEHVFTKTTPHINKMEGHTQRAILDLCKFLCHRNKEEINKKIANFHAEDIRIVDNGDFYPKIIGLIHEAHKSFERAKIFDVNLGEDNRTNSDVLGLYVRAYFDYYNLISVIKEKEPAIICCKAHNKRKANKDRLIDGFVGAVFGGLVTYLAGYSYLFIDLFNIVADILRKNGFIP